MTSAIVSFALVLASGTTAWPGFLGEHIRNFHNGGRITAPGPGNGYGFPNNNPDGVGWVYYGTSLPLGADRTGEYYFPRHFTIPADQLFMPTYYNAYVTRGQRYIPYVGCGGAHAASGPPMGSGLTPVHPYNDTIGSGPRVSLPAFSGRVEAAPVNSGGTGLTP